MQGYHAAMASARGLFDPFSVEITEKQQRVVAAVKAMAAEVKKDLWLQATRPSRCTGGVAYIADKVLQLVFQLFHARILDDLDRHVVIKTSTQSMHISDCVLQIP
jgi:hypothetical protein